MEELLDIIIQQNNNNAKAIQDALDIIITQNSTNNSNDNLENLLVQNKQLSESLTKTINEGIDGLKESLKIEPKEEKDYTDLFTAISTQIKQIGGVLGLIQGKETEKLAPILADIASKVDSIEKYDDTNLIKTIKDLTSEIENIEIPVFKFDYSRLSEIRDEIKKLPFNTYKVDISKHEKPENALAVKLYDKDGDIIERFASGGGGYPDVWLKNVLGTKINPATEDTLFSLTDKVLNDYVNVKLFDQNGNGLDIQIDPTTGKNRLLGYSKIQSGDASEGDTLYVAAEDGAMLAAGGAVLLAGVDNLTTNIRQRLLQTEAVSLKNHLLVKDAYSASINTNLARVVGIADDIAGTQSIIIGAVVDGKLGNSSGDYATLNVNKSAVLRVIPSSGSNDVNVLKEASDTISGVNVMGVAAFQDASGKGVCPALDSSRRVIVSATNVSGSGTGLLLKNEDVAHANADAGVAVWARRIDTLAVSSGSSGDYSTINEDKDGALYINPESGLWSRSDTYTTATAGATIDCSHNPKKHFSIQCKGTNTQVGTTTWTINLEVSLDNVNWKTLITHTYPTDTDGDIKTYATSPFPIKYYRSNCSALTLGTATNVITTILGIN